MTNTRRDHGVAKSISLRLESKVRNECRHQVNRRAIFYAPQTHSHVCTGNLKGSDEAKLRIAIGDRMSSIVQRETFTPGGWDNTPVTTL